MKTSKLDSKKVLDLIQEESQILLKKRECYNKIKDILDVVKQLNECRGMVSSFGFKAPNDAMNTAGPSGFGVDTPTLISRVSELHKDMEGFGDEFEPVEGVENDVEALKAENEMLKRELEEIKNKLK